MNKKSLAFAASAGGGQEEVAVWYEPTSAFEEWLLKTAIMAQAPDTVMVHCPDGDPCMWQADLIVRDHWEHGWLHGRLHVERAEVDVATLRDGPMLPIRFRVVEKPKPDPEHPVCIEWELLGKGNLAQTGEFPKVPMIWTTDIDLG